VYRGFFVQEGERKMKSSEMRPWMLLHKVTSRLLHISDPKVWNIGVLKTYIDNKKKKKTLSSKLHMLWSSGGIFSVR
jgi:hypothetical protein